MLYSMTGYGKASTTLNNKQLSVELRSLNSKFLDLHLKMPPSLREKELEIRTLVQDTVERGKVELSISIEETGNPGNFHVNLNLLKQYYQEVEKLQNELGAASGDIIQSLLQLPNVVEPVEEPISKEEWETLQKLYDEAFQQFKKFRSTEGENLGKDLLSRIDQIESSANEVKGVESNRVEKIKDRIKSSLESSLPADAVDQNRFEQELIFYLEKLDINEELVRLQAHCDHFRESISAEGVQKGKKLGFISQELGREINTLGSKANDSNIQRIVVLMKEHLEKIKEQVLNIV